jgi:excisionase family DNA binding protein
VGTGEGDVEKLDAYLTIRDAAEFLGVSTNTLRNWGRDRKVPMHRNPINGYRLFKRSDLEELLKEIARSRSDSNKEHRRAK